MAQTTVGHVFMSYSRRDNDVMWRIVRFLRGKGIKVWVDNENLIPGTPIWEDEIEKAINGASAVVVVLSPEAKRSEWVKREISLADQNRKRIFPVLVSGDEDSAITLRLITRQHVDIRQNEKLGLNSLGVALRIYLDELEAQETVEKSPPEKTNPARVEEKSTEEKKQAVSQGHSERFYRIWWSALTKPTETNYQKLIEIHNVSQITAYWWLLVAAVIFTNVLVPTNFGLLAFTEMVVPKSAGDPLLAFSPAEAQWLAELSKLDTSKAILIALQLKLDKLRFQNELGATHVNVPNFSPLDFSLLDLAIINLSVSLIFITIIISYTIVASQIAKARGGYGTFTKLIYLLSAYTAPAVIGASCIASLMATNWVLSFLDFASSFAFIPLAVGIMLLLFVLFGTVATKTAYKLSWKDAVISGSTLPVVILFIFILPLLIKALDSVSVW